MKRLSLLLAVVVLGAVVAGCAQYQMKAWDRNTHEELGEWYVYRDCWGTLRTVDEDAEVCLGQATVILEEVREPANRLVLRERSEDDR